MLNGKSNNVNPALLPISNDLFDKIGVRRKFLNDKLFTESRKNGFLNKLFASRVEEQDWELFIAAIDVVLDVAKMARIARHDEKTFHQL